MANPPQAIDADVVADPAEVHRLKQRRLLFAIELTLLALVLILGLPGSASMGIVLAVFALLVALSGL